MPRYEARRSTDRVLIIEAADEATALSIAENTDYSEWDTAADSWIEVQRLEEEDDDA